jgi:hypothetical protein
MSQTVTGEEEEEEEEEEDPSTTPGDVPMQE